MTPYFERIERQLGTILAELSAVLAPGETAKVIEFIKVGEYGVALETLTALIEEEHKPLSLETFDRVVTLAETMGLRQSVVTEALRDRVVERP